MKKFLIALLLASTALTATSRADTPAQIAADYRKQSAQAVERLNQSLEKATTPLITKLVASGDTAGAELLTAQLKSKLAGEPVSAPQASAVQLFTLFDEARAKALAPVQKSSIARIDSLLKTAGGPKLETVTELGKIRAEIEAGKVSEFPTIPVEWTYHQTADGPGVAVFHFFPDGRFELDDYKGKQTGTWKPGIKPNTLAISCASETWKVAITGSTATIERGKVGTRFLKAKPPVQGK